MLGVTCFSSVSNHDYYNRLDVKLVYVIGKWFTVIHKFWNIILFMIFSSKIFHNLTSFAFIFSLLNVNLTELCCNFLAVACDHIYTFFDVNVC
jgi:hypothetical protein